MEQLNVLTLNRVGFFGGVERVVVSCGQAVQSRGFNTIVACPLPGELAREVQRCGLEALPLSIDRSKASRSPLNWARLLGALRRGRREVTDIARRRHVRLLHVHHPIGALYGLQAARELGIPLVLHVHETLPVHRLYRIVARQVIPHCAAIACVSQSSRECMLALGAPSKLLRVIYNGVDPSFLGTASPVRDLHQPGPHIGVFGVLEPRKGQDIFVQAARRVAARYPSAQFWIVGELSFEENSSYKKSIYSGIEAAGLKDRIHLTGHRRDIRDWMHNMSLIVLASRDRESLPTVLIEGALLGRPLIGTAVGGVREIIEDGRTGLVVPPDDPDALATAMLRSLGGEGPALGAAARVDALQRFTYDRFGEDVAALYRSVLRTHEEVSA